MAILSDTITTRDALAHTGIDLALPVTARLIKLGALQYLALYNCTPRSMHCQLWQARPLAVHVRKSHNHNSPNCQCKHEDDSNEHQPLLKNTCCRQYQRYTVPVLAVPPIIGLVNLCHRLQMLGTAARCIHSGGHTTNSRSAPVEARYLSCLNNSPCRQLPASSSCS